MDRLTVDTNIIFCDIAQCAEDCGGVSCKEGYCDQRRIYEKLRMYESTEEQGQLMWLPCKVGIDVYAIINKGIKTCVCIGWKWGGGSIYMLCMDRETGQEFSFFDFHFTDKTFGLKTVFLTLQEAEKALEDAK